MKKKKVNKKNIILLSGLTIGTTATLSVYFIVKTFGNPFGGGGSGAITPPKVVSLQQPSVYCPIYKLTFDQYVNLSEPLITNKSDDSVVFGVNFSFSIETSTISLINDDDLLRIVNKEVKLNLKAKNSVGWNVDTDFSFTFAIDSTSFSSFYSFNNVNLPKNIWDKTIPSIPISLSGAGASSEFAIEDITDVEGVEYESTYSYPINQSISSGNRKSFDDYFSSFLTAATFFNNQQAETFYKYPLGNFDWYNNSSTDFATLKLNTQFNIINQASFLSLFGSNHFVNLVNLKNYYNSFFEQVHQNISINFKNIGDVPLSFGTPDISDSSEQYWSNTKKLFLFNKDFFSSFSDFWTWIGDIGFSTYTDYKDIFFGEDSENKLEVNVDLCSDDFDMLGGRTKDIPAFFSYNNSQLTNSLQINNSLTDVENILDNVDYEKEFKFNYELPSVINDLSIPTVWNVIDNEGTIIDTQKRFIKLRGNMTYASASGESYLYTHFNYPIIGTENNFMNSFDVGFSWTEGSFFAKQYRQLNWPFYSKNILDSTFSEVSLFPLGGFEYYYSAFRSE